MLPVWSGQRCNLIVKNASAFVRPFLIIKAFSFITKGLGHERECKGCLFPGGFANGAIWVIGSVSCRACDIPFGDVPLCRCPVQKQITTSCKKRHMMRSVIVRALCLCKKVLYSRTTQWFNGNCVDDAKQPSVSVAHGPITTAKIAIYV